MDEQVSWWNYANAYDLLCKINPYYQDNIESFSRWLASLEFNEPINFCEVGAGTGNFIEAASSVLSDASFFHWDWNSTMNEIASHKYTNARIEVEIQNTDIRDFPGDLPRQDVLLAVNALYTFPNPHEVLRRAYDLLKPGGWFYTIDLGRPLNTRAWFTDLVCQNVKTIGVVETVKTTYKLRHAVTQNRKIDRSQSDGNYWHHEPEEFQHWLEEVGFQVLEADTCYRDVCDRAICQKPTSAITVDLEGMPEPEREEQTNQLPTQSTSQRA